MPDEQTPIKPLTGTVEAKSATKGVRRISLIERVDPPLSPVQQRLAESAQKLGLTPEGAEVFARGRR